jgi:hypothetical protein
VVYLCHPSERALDCIPSTLVNRHLTNELTPLVRHGSYPFYEASLLGLRQD